MRSTFTFSLALAGLLAVVCNLRAADDEVFSGPQPGEPLTKFEMQPVLGADSETALDVVTKAGEKPIVLIFVHKLTRPSVAVFRTVMDYAAKRSKDGMQGAVVFLGDDKTATIAQITRAKHAMPQGVPVGISVDGAEGPGAYGLNREVTLTVLVGVKGKVTANFALVQPSVQADVPKIAAAMVKVLGGGKVPSLQEMSAGMRMRRPATKKPAGNEQDPQLRPLLRPIIQKDAEPADVDKGVAALEAYLNKKPKVRAQVQAIAKRIVDSGKLANYGTEHAQSYIKKWAEEVEPSAKKKDDAKSRSRE